MLVRWGRRAAPGLARMGSTQEPATISSRSAWRTIAALVTVGAVGAILGALLAPEPTRDSAQPASDVLHVGDRLDDFNRERNLRSLGSFDAETRWRAEAGVWGVFDGQAKVSGPAQPVNLALVPLARGNGAVEVRMTNTADGGGLVFRYQDPENHWYVVALPSYVTWTVVKVVAGVESTVINTGLSAVADGTTIGVRLNGEKIDVALDGRVVRTITDPALQSATLVGMTARGAAAADVRFDDFRLAVDGE